MNETVNLVSSSSSDSFDKILEQPVFPGKYFFSQSKSKLIQPTGSLPGKIDEVRALIDPDVQSQTEILFEKNTFYCI